MHGGLCAWRDVVKCPTPYNTKIEEGVWGVDNDNDARFACEQMEREQSEVRVQSDVRITYTMVDCRHCLHPMRDEGHSFMIDGINRLVINLTN